MKRNIFYCKRCNTKYELEVQIREFSDPVYGPCRKEYAICPVCGDEINTISIPSISASSDHSTECNGCNFNNSCNCQIN